MSHNRFFQGLHLAVIVALLAMVVLTVKLAPITRAATIGVTTTDDELNVDGDCSLREAIRAANLDTAVDACATGDSADTISLPAGTYTLSIGGRDEDAAAAGDLDITAGLTITGALSSTTIVDGNALDRVFETLGAANVTLSNLTIRNGNPGMSNEGGGIKNAGTLTLTSSIVVSNTVDTFAGGGISNSGTLTVTESTINGNTGPFGGGIDNDGRLMVTGSTIGDNTGGGITNAGTLTVHDSVVSGNESESSGGGIANFRGALTVSSSSIISNTSELGGGIRNNGTLTVTGSIISGNSGEIGGGIATEASDRVTLIDSTISNNVGSGIDNFGALAVTGSTISGNRANGIFNDVRGTLVMTDSTISNNADSGANNRGTLSLIDSAVSDNTALIDGGGLMNSGTLTMTNSTISGNSATGNGGGIASSGTSVSLNNVTIAKNSANSHSDGTGDGGGVYNGPDSAFSLKNTIVAGNTVNRSGSAIPTHPDCSGTFNSLGYNLIGDRAGAGCDGFVAGVNGDLVGDSTSTGALDPGLGPLQDNGGPTLTHALLATSPAINAGSPMAPGCGGNACEATDQRGVARPQGARCDIGAYERAVLAPDIHFVFLPIALKGP